MIERTITETAGSFHITLPKQWVEGCGMGKGDKVVMVIKKGKIELIPKKWKD